MVEPGDAGVLRKVISLMDYLAEVSDAAQRDPVRNILSDETGAPEAVVWLDELPDGVRFTPRAWLATGPDEELVVDVFDALFLEGLHPAYQRSLRLTNGNAVDRSRFPDHKQQQILRVLTELADALSRPEGGGLPDAQRIIAELVLFVRASRLGDLGAHELPKQCWTTYCHGDLHTRNVLIYRGRHPAPTLIDASDFGLDHWAKDPARIAIDLLLRSFDADVESLFFTRFGIWRQLAGQLGDLAGPLVAPCPSPATRAALVALNWLATRLRAFCAPLTDDAEFEENHWEWRIVLAYWLLRSIRYTDVPAPKKALGIVAAHDQLTAAAQR